MIRNLILIVLTLLVSCKNDKHKSSINSSTASIAKKEEKKYKPEIIDPFRNGNLHQSYDNQKVDFSSDYYKLRIASHTESTTPLKNLGHYNFSSLLPKDRELNGIIGVEYKALEITITEVSKTQNVTGSYKVVGQSTVNTNICDFQGFLNITDALVFTNPEFDHITQGVVLGNYDLKEDDTQNHVGQFKGTFESYFLLDQDSDQIYLDTLFEIADGYNNNNFVGTWTEYESSNSKKCIWGEYRLPFTFDYDIGDGEMLVNPKYRPVIKRPSELPPNITWKNCGFDSLIIRNKVSKLAKDIYFGNQWNLSQDDMALALLDSLNAKNKSVRPFYFKIASKTLEKSDGYYAEGLGGYSKSFVERNTQEFASHFDNEECFTRNDLEDWARMVMLEFGLVQYNEYEKAGSIKDLDSSEFDQYLSKLKSNCRDCSQDQLSTINEFCGILQAKWNELFKHVDN